MTTNSHYLNFYICTYTPKVVRFFYFLVLPRAPMLGHSFTYYLYSYLKYKTSILFRIKFPTRLSKWHLYNYNTYWPRNSTSNAPPA